MTDYTPEERAEFPNIAAGLRVWWFHEGGSVHATCTEHPEWGDRMCGSPDWVMARYAAHLVAHHAIKPGAPRDRAGRGEGALV